VVKKIRAVMRFRVFLLSFLFLACMAQTAAAADGETKGALDGEVFLVEKGEVGKPPDGKDTYIFRDGKFRSTYCEKHYGFGEGAYSSTKKGNTITFAADTRSESHGTIHWEGTVKVGEIDVRYAWASRKGNPKPKEHWARSVTEWGMKDPGPPGGGAVSHLLDGKIYYVKTGEEGKGPDHDDYLIFQDGMFTSSGCVGSWNFRNASYSATGFTKSGTGRSTGFTGSGVNCWNRIRCMRTIGPAPGTREHKGHRPVRVPIPVHGRKRP
jgi:hypothetical protein